jgi:fatty acid desaturase
VRVGDRERDAAVARLSEHAAAGRLTVGELEERIDRAHAAVYAGELRALEADLPAPRRPAPRPAPPVAPLLVLLAAIALSAAIGHPVVPLFILAALLWRGRYLRMKRTVAVIEP